jgi:hypothetical protein
MVSRVVRTITADGKEEERVLLEGRRVPYGFRPDLICPAAYNSFPAFVSTFLVQTSHGASSFIEMRMYLRTGIWITREWLEFSDGPSVGLPTLNASAPARRIGSSGRAIWTPEQASQPDSMPAGFPGLAKEDACVRHKSMRTDGESD